MAGPFFRRGLYAFEAWKASDRTKIVLVVGSIVTLATYQVLSRAATKEGHSLLSSEKPQELRGETTRDVATEKAKLAASADSSMK
jgi:hypothetical protein